MLRIAGCEHALKLAKPNTGTGMERTTLAAFALPRIAPLDLGELDADDAGISGNALSLGDGLEGIDARDLRRTPFVVDWGGGRAKEGLRGL